MRKISLFFLFAFLTFFVVLDDTATGETFASVDLYISDMTPFGQLRVEEPSGSSTESARIADNGTYSNEFQEVGRWSTDSLDVSSNISGEWSGKAWVSSNRDVTVTLRYTLIQNDNNLDEFEFSGDVNAGETTQLMGDSDFSFQGLDDSSITLLVEGKWTGDSPDPENNLTITLEYGSSSRDTKVTIPISHLRMSSGSSPSLVTGQNSYYVYIEVSDVFGVDGILSMAKGDYSMQMGPDGDSPWSADVDKVSDKGDYVEVRFLWSFEGHTLPVGENIYNIEVYTTDLLSDLYWSKNLQTTIYIEPEPDAEIEAVSSTSKVVEFGKTAIYTLVVRNSGSGGDEFIITYDNSDNWNVSIDIYYLELDAGDSQYIKVNITPSDSVSDGEESPTIITVTAASDSEVYDSITLITTAREPEPDWDFSISIDEDDNKNFDYGCGCFVISDRVEIEITIILTNNGNQQNNFYLDFYFSDNAAFSGILNRSSLYSVSPNQNEIVVLNLTPLDDYYGTNTWVEFQATSAGDSKVESIIIEFILEYEEEPVEEEEVEEPPAEEIINEEEVEELVDCDVVVGIDGVAFSFDRPSVEIELGQTVCWQWGSAEGWHNIAQVAESGSTGKLSNGFYSGAPSFPMDFRVTFDEAGGYSNGTTYYYICEPHVAMGMAGEVVVRSTDDSESLIELDNPGGVDTLPSLSLIISLSVIGIISILRRKQ